MMKTNENKKISIGILEDDYTLGETIAKYLTTTDNFQVEFVHNSLSSLLLNDYKSNLVEIVLLDLHLKDGLCVNNILSIYKTFPFAKVIIMTGDYEENNLLNAIENGANGYIFKPFSMNKLIDTISKVQEFGAYFEAEQVYNLTKMLKRRKLEFINNTNINLTAKQKQVLKLLKSGNSYKQIGEILVISPHTVNQHIKNIYRKYKVKSKSEVMDILDLL